MFKEGKDFVLKKSSYRVFVKIDCDKLYKFDFYTCRFLNDI